MKKKYCFAEKVLKLILIIFSKYKNSLSVMLQQIFSIYEFYFFTLEPLTLSAYYYYQTSLKTHKAFAVAKHSVLSLQYKCLNFSTTFQQGLPLLSPATITSEIYRIDICSNIYPTVFIFLMVTCYFLLHNTIFTVIYNFSLNEYTANKLET